ncbi:putative F-box protein At3g52320 [Papaver somniferum]|uniref:putative F-box protein At3g52320 n=1 Tax=Papaver somniferum TaxID=3469 RepID=UPI000E704A40|nr:putative F-box protein At3g52320 [Papaver somniferum]
MMIKENKGCGDDSEVNPSNTITPYLCDDIVNDILSRLPVKSLMRFKLVCKDWQNSIQNDLYFMYLHLTNSKERHDPGVMDLIFKTSTKPISPGSRGSDLCLANVCRTNKHHHNKPVVAARHRYKSLYNTPEFWGIFMRPLNGLICFVKKHEGYIRVANITTGEETPWVKATLKDDYEINIWRYKCDWWTGFGYDPATKQHKVICIYKKHYLDAQRKDIGEVEEVC